MSKWGFASKERLGSSKSSFLTRNQWHLLCLNKQWLKLSPKIQATTVEVAFSWFLAKQQSSQARPWNWKCVKSQWAQAIKTMTPKKRTSRTFSSLKEIYKTWRINSSQPSNHLTSSGVNTGTRKAGMWRQSLSWTSCGSSKSVLRLRWMVFSSCTRSKKKKRWRSWAKSFSRQASISMRGYFEWI